MTALPHRRLPRVGLGWPAPLLMSGNQGSPYDRGGWGSENRNPVRQRLEATHRSIRWCLASDTNPRIRCGVTNAGVAHTLAVCLVEVFSMARGNGKPVGPVKQSSMPRFVDVPLGAEERTRFLAWEWDDEFLVHELQRLCDAGYRVGCAWTAESQSYTVSLTCRDETSVNAGLCMTSFAKTLQRAVALALFKHAVIAEGNWLGVASATSDDFG